ncbi:hypothetical protein HGRIS_005830 [Hohenbuehelia grisea]|uniref:ATP-dependent DNA helicase CHL1 n=1 Tax=Hohenbuehelia grisea TaxID=104357 RepID=A0ABR3JY63_9AGAR
MSLSLSTPETFPAFPYAPPYQIQTDLMKHLYAAIEGRKVAIVESPTGTGKTLSLLCSALTWLSDEKHRARRGKLDVVGSAATPDWVVEQSRQRIMRELDDETQEMENRLANARKKEALRKHMARAKVTKRSKPAPAPPGPVPPLDNDLEYLPDEDTETDSNLSSAVRALMNSFGKPDPTGGHSASGHVTAEPTCTKIFYASRTHSQLTQVIPELKKLKLRVLDPKPPTAKSEQPFSLPLKRPVEDDCDPEAVSYTRTVSLGSRKQLCINDDLRKKRKDLDEGCRELLDAKGDKRCPFLPLPKEASELNDLRDEILASPKDIEDLANAGRTANICPYFGSRRAIPQAELVTLPYNLLLSQAAREALGIDLTDQVVIIDEAHNLIPTLLSLSTVHLTLGTLSTALHQVCHYVARFRTRLSAFHLLHLKRLVTLLDAFKKFLVNWKSKTSGNPKPESLTTVELLQRASARVIGMNLLEVQGYLQQSKIARKISKYAEDADHEKTEVTSMPPLLYVEAFMQAISNSSEDGRVIIEALSDVELRYQQLNPEPPFADIIKQSRAVIIAGGTMSPMSDFVNQLCPNISSEHITMFSCGHIVASSHLQTMLVDKGPSGQILNFKSGNQSDLQLISELGKIIISLACITPAGMVVFFPSYKFLYACGDYWQKEDFFVKISSHKNTFFEPQATQDVEAILQEYSVSVRSDNGAILFAVIGAKLSEGLNFSDDLARSVILVGLPFPNLGSADLQARLKYVKSQAKQQNQLKDAGAELYENMCMNSVNQSIGRAIRHQNDWASLVLIDQRYQSQAIQKKLPKWIGGSCVVPETFSSLLDRLQKFYDQR